MSSTKLVKKNLFTKPYLLTLDEISEIGQNMNLVGYDPQLNITSDDTNIVLKYGVPSSPKILNWVEPYKIAGIDYTLFYTEVNSGLNIGDRVFIINGTYDSNLLIQNDKYKKGHDGYKVLFIDKCKVVLDIEFVGSLPSNETTENKDDFDDFIKVYYLKDQNDFIHVNRQITTRVSNGKVDFKFNRNQNNIVFTSSDFSDIIDNWGKNEGLSGAPGFFIKNATASWTNISSDFMTGSYSIAATSSNNKILILNDSFTYNGFEFKENSIYSWEYDKINATYSWLVNIKHENNNVPILTKSNFRKGSFNGTWNGGLYGSNDKRITWGSTTSYWNHGTLLNTIWEKGIIESKYSQLESHISEFDKYGLPYQKSTNPDNDGYGYNFIINSEIRNAVINNGNVSNSTLIGGTSTVSIIEEHVRGNLTEQFISNNFNNSLINKAYFESCGINNSNIENAVIKNSRVNNSRLYSVKSINTHYKSSLFKNSNYISDNIIKILDFDEFEYSDSNNTTHLVYKFYINKRSYEKFKFKDNFYIKGIKLNYSVTNAKFLETEPNINSILNLFDKKFKIGPWKEYVDVYDNMNNLFTKSTIEFNSFISTAKENQYRHDVISNISIINQTGNENEKGYSLDIFIKLDSGFLINSGINQNNVSYKDVIDFSNAYIQNSDFESGVVENSNWNSGSHINYNGKINLVSTLNYNGEYDISLTQSTSLVLNNLTNLSTSNDEFDLDYLKINDIIFLNAIDHDSRGTVTSVDIVQGGSGYLTSNGITASYIQNTGNGIGLKLNISANTIGGVLSLTYNDDGNGYGYSGNYTANNISGIGDGLILNIIRDISDDTLLSFTIDSIGQGYQIGDIIEVSTNGQPGTFTIDDISNGEVVSVSVNTSGLFYEIGDIVDIETGDGFSQIIITGVTGSLTRLPDTYKILNLDPFIVDEIVLTGSTSIISSLLPVGIFSSYGANNRYGYLHKTKFYKSKIVSGLFRRSYIKGSLIKNDSVDISDKDFTNIDKLKSLMIVDNIFSKNDNILSNALYSFSSFVDGTDIWDNGILFRSIWNGMIFNNGLVKESTWLDGTFLNGLFYMSSLSSMNIPFYNSNNLSSYYMSGSTLNDNNNRLSWRKGKFINGEFYKSKWEDGSFNGGKFYYSDFYNGVINGGIIGDKSISVNDTKVYNGVINYATVENANFTADYTDNNLLNSNNIDWYDGIFNDGIFNTYGTNSATWYNGTFNGGEFGPISTKGSNTNIPKWKNGIFNGGKFTSVYGTSSSILSNNSILNDITSYAWEDGIFNGGEFGNAETGYNSSWFNGVFNGGKFIGKVWNNGIFTFGEFSGSGKTQSGLFAIGGTASSVDSNPNKFVETFISTLNNYYGLWRSGFVSDTKNKYLDQEIFTDLQRVSDINKNLPFTLLKDILWVSGTFSHPSATIQNSVWLDGTFENGTFKYSSFNPYVKRNRRLDQTFNFSDTCKWTNGLFDSGEFSISNWENGRFIMGTATGMIWKNGIVNYMNAYNVFWEDGLWRNGNWEGSYYNISPDGSVIDPYVQQILNRGMSWSGTSSCHIWSVFYKESLTQFTNPIQIEAGEVVHQINAADNQPPLPPTQFGTINTVITPGVVSNKKLGKIEWTTPTSSGIMSLNVDLSPNDIDNNMISSGFDGPVFVVKKQSTGKYICAGGFTSYKGQPIKSVCRLNIDFTLDTTFTPPNYNTYIYNMEIDASDRIYIGSFQTIYNKKYLQRLQANGAQDISYPNGVGFNAAIMSMKLLSNGKLIIVGVFTSFSGSLVKGIIRLTTLGMEDLTFNGVSQGFINGSSLPRTIALQSDGKIVIGGDFTMYNNTVCGNIVILNPNGSLFTTPARLDNSPAGYNITKILVDLSDRIYVTGKFERIANSSTVQKIIRLTSLGIEDTGFNVSSSGIDNGNTIDRTGGFDMLLNSSGNLVIVGDFGTIKGLSTSNIGVLDDTGNISNELRTTQIGGVINTILDLGDKYVIGGEFSSYINPKMGDDSNVSIKFTGIDQYNSVTWEIFNGSSWTTSSSIPNLLDTKTFTLGTGINKFRVSGNNPDNNNIYSTNELVYTFNPTNISAYPEVIISGQTWFSKNLDVTKYRNGDDIPQAMNQSELIAYANSLTGCWSYSEFSSSNASYGRLYSWYAVNDPRGIAPVGYHVPSIAEWTTLSDYLGGYTTAGGDLKEVGTTNWVSPNLNATDSLGFTVLPAGKNIEAGGMIYPPSNKGRWGYFWVSDVFSATHAKLVFFKWDSASIYLTTNEDKGTNQSVRLIKD